MEEINIAETVRELTIAAEAKPQLLEGSEHPFIIAPPKRNAVSLEEFLPNPLRINQKIDFYDTKSFITYFNEYSSDNSVIFGDTVNHGIMCVFDYHNIDQAKWCKHKGYYSCPVTEEWKIWNQNDGRKMKQADFADFIENNLPDFYKPNAAKILEMVTNISSKTTVSFKQKYSTHNGLTTLNYSEVQGDGAGTMELPDTFIIRIPVFLNTEPVEINVRLRVRIREGVLTLWYDLLQPHKILEEAFKQILEEVEEGTDKNILMGRV